MNLATKPAERLLGISRLPFARNEAHNLAYVFPQISSIVDEILPIDRHSPDDPHSRENGLFLKLIVYERLHGMQKSASARI
jgi:hypothetical protein